MLRFFKDLENNLIVKLDNATKCNILPTVQLVSHRRNQEFRLNCCIPGQPPICMRLRCAEEKLEQNIKHQVCEEEET